MQQLSRLLIGCILLRHRIDTNMQAINYSKPLLTANENRYILLGCSYIVFVIDRKVNVIGGHFGPKW